MANTNTNTGVQENFEELFKRLETAVDDSYGNRESSYEHDFNSALSDAAPGAYGMSPNQLKVFLQQLKGCSFHVTLGDSTRTLSFLQFARIACMTGTGILASTSIQMEEDYSRYITALSAKCSDALPYFNFQGRVNLLEWIKSQAYAAVKGKVTMVKLRHADEKGNLVESEGNYKRYMALCIIGSGVGEKRSSFYGIARVTPDNKTGAMEAMKGITNGFSFPNLITSLYKAMAYRLSKDLTGVEEDDKEVKELINELETVKDWKKHEDFQRRYEKLHSSGYTYKSRGGRGVVFKEVAQ